MRYFKIGLLIVLLLSYSFTLLAQNCPVSITPTSSSFCTGGSASLKASGADSIYTWAPAAGLSIITGSTVTANPTITTTYTVVGTSKSKCTASKTVVVTVNPNPVPSFTYTQPNPCSNNAVNFKSTTPGAGLIYKWDFGNNKTSNQANPAFTYNTTGNNSFSYNARLTVTNSFGCKDSTATQKITVKEIPDAAIADFTSNVAFTNCGGSSFDLTIDNTSSTAATNTNYQIIWGDGSGTFSTASLPSTGTVHTYASEGYFTISLEVTGQNGCKADSAYKVFNGSNPGVGFKSNGGTVLQCLPAIDTFFISYPSKNPPGTTYTVTFNDGSAPIIFNHPPPSSFTHTFTTTSCGASGGNTPNTFFVKIRAQNPCGFLDGDAEPITTITPPEANFSISPGDTACINSVVTFTNTTTKGDVVSNDGVCDTTNIPNWVITPQTGWTLANGLFGNTNPTKNSTTWGTQSIGISFTSPGTYSMKLVDRNNGPKKDANNNECRMDSISKSICVVIPPVPSFKANPLTGCNPLVVSFTNTSTGIKQCSLAKILWTVKKISSTCIADSTNDYVFTSGTKQDSLNSVIRFNNQGTYNVTLSLTNACGTFTTLPTVVTVKRKPQITLSVPASVCLGQSVSPSPDTMACGNAITAYNWTFPGGNPPSSTSETPGAVSYSTTGVKNISVKVTNGCGATSVNASVNVLQPPVANAGTKQQFCSGGSTALGATTTGGYSYQWSPTTGLSSSTISNPTVTLTNNGTTPLTYTYKLTVSAGSCSDVDSVLVTVNPSPLPIITPTLNSICVGGTTTLTAGGANTYSWSPSSGLNKTTGAVVIASPTITTVYTLTGIAANSCSASGTITITVNQPPVISVSAAPSTICIGGNTDITGSGANTYTWSSSGGLSPTSGSIITISPTITTTYSVIGTDNNTCSASKITVVTVVSLPPVLASASKYTICNGQFTTLTGSGATSYSWDPSTGLTNPNASPTQASPLVTTTYTLTGTAGSNCSATDTVVVNVNPLPLVGVNSVSYCPGGSATLIATGANTYSWAPATALSSSTGATVTVTSGSTTSYVVTGTNTATGCANVSTAGVTVYPLPVISINPTPSVTICIGNSTDITASGASTYAWLPATGLNLTSGATVMAKPVAFSSYTYTVTGTSTDGCTGTASVTVNVIALPSVSATASAYTICNGQPTTLTGSGANTYSWSPSISLSAATGAIVTATPTVTTTYTLTGVSGANCEGTVIVVINVNPLPTVTVNSFILCAGDSNTLTAGGAGTYSWALVTGLNNSTGASVIAKPLVTTTYTVSGKATLTGCVNTATSIVTVNPLPSVTNSPISQTVCSGNSTVAVTWTSDVAGTTYSWNGTSANGVTGFTTSGNGDLPAIILKQ